MSEEKKSTKKKPQTKKTAKEDEQELQKDSGKIVGNLTLKYTVRVTPEFDGEIRRIYNSFYRSSMTLSTFLRNLLEIGLAELKKSIEPASAEKPQEAPEEVELAEKDEEGWFEVQGRKIKLVPF